MKTNIFLVILLIFFSGCKQNPKLKVIEIPLMEVKENGLYAIFDTVINFERQRCSYYQDSLYFWVDIYSKGIILESGLDLVKTLDTNPIGYFTYRNHLFFVHRLEENWLSFTNKKRKFSYQGYYDGMIDDSWTLSVFKKEKGVFSLKERSSYCADNNILEEISLLPKIFDLASAFKLHISTFKEI